MLLFSQLREGLIWEAGPGPQEGPRLGGSGKQAEAKCFQEPQLQRNRAPSHLSDWENCSWGQQKRPWKAEHGPRCQQVGLVPHLEYSAVILLVIV